MSKSKFFNEEYLGLVQGSYKVVDIHPSAFNKNAPLWIVQCVCGKQMEVMPSLFISGNYARCSCGAQSMASENEDGASREWSITPADRQRILKYRWILIQRCYNPGFPSYHNYGDKDISVYQGWINSSNDFVDWSIKNGYRPWLTIKRHNILKGYTPENSFWGVEDGTLHTEEYHKPIEKLDSIDGIKEELLKKEIDSGRLLQANVEDVLRIVSNNTNIGGDTSVRLRKKCLSTLVNALEASNEAMLTIIAHNIRKDVPELRRAEDNLDKAITFLNLAMSEIREED